MPNKKERIIEDVSADRFERTCLCINRAYAAALPVYVNNVTIELTLIRNIYKYKFSISVMCSIVRCETICILSIRLP